MEKKPELVQVSAAWNSKAGEGKPLGQNRYLELQIKSKKPLGKAASIWQKPCDQMAEAILVDGGKRGQIVKVCADLTCRVHHPNQPSPQEVERERLQRRQSIEKEKLTITVRHRTLAAILKAVSSPLKKADWQLIALHLIAALPHHLQERMEQ